MSLKSHREFVVICGTRNFRNLKTTANQFLQSLAFFALKNGGGDRIRTGVQTYPSKAFYMLILF